jgi:hypothetical protein
MLFYYLIFHIYVCLIYVLPFHGKDLPTVLPHGLEVYYN